MEIESEPFVQQTSMLSITPSPFSYMSTSGFNFQMFYTNLSQALVEQVYLYGRDNLIKLQMYIKDPYVTRFLRQEKITQMSFVGTIGGSLGLFLGFSFISAIDILALLISVLKNLLRWTMDEIKYCLIGPHKIWIGFSLGTELRRDPRRYKVVVYYSH